jgi:prepilin-type N-terminal cleavage/methylation domain-containing protein
MKSHRVRGFSLTELLVAMGIIAIIGGITAIGIRTVARDAKLSSGANIVVAALDNGRSLAIRENTYVIVAFRARLDRDNRQYTEVVTAKWTGETPMVFVGSTRRGIDQFVPYPGVATRRLPPGIKVGGPLYHSSGGTNYDDKWTTQSNLTNSSELPMRILGVMYASDGTVVTRNSVSDGWRAFIDFDNDGLQQVAGCITCEGVLDYSDPPNSIPNNFSAGCTSAPPEFNVGMMQQNGSDDEPYITMVPFLAVFDDDDLRSNYDVSLWNTNWCQQQDDHSEYILENADFMHFNRYTGVVLR